MPTEYIKDIENDGKVLVIDTVVKEETLDLYELKQKKTILEGQIASKRSLYTQQVQFENERASQALADAGVKIDAEINAWQAELDVINASIQGAIDAGVKEIIPEPVDINPITEEIIK